ncbi:NlpC/P60 family protein [Roseibium aggregatum]|uniref:NlpC/P60 family protein n=1 Tax=Roseibium aggregatum TaxID=187304 RepID=A0A0M6Y6P6_9HYPH|nr:NlpC/P60 family protein [Roseibium aggregatum]CTQ45775.1 NlpC/P60 family protein [Roseibium aggregatum]
MFSSKAIAEAKDHARKTFPEEMVGYISGDKFVPLTNVADDPVEDFEVSPVEWFKASDVAEVLIHSHTNGNDFPSRIDMESQIEMGIPWGIIVTNGTEARDPFFWGDTLPREGLIGRVFRHGVTDCYSLIRDYFRSEKDVVIPDFPRSHKWWDNGENMYLEGFEKAGFVEIREDEVQPGDCFLMKVGTQVPSHAGVYLGNNTILHHLPARLSRSEPFGGWLKLVSHWVRYVDASDGLPSR